MHGILLLVDGVVVVVVVVVASASASASDGLKGVLSLLI